MLKRRHETKRVFLKKGQMNEENKQLISLKMFVGKCAVLVGLVDQLGFVLPAISFSKVAKLRVLSL